MTDDCRLFETICLEGFQSGLSWLTILRKRESFRWTFVGPTTVYAFMQAMGPVNDVQHDCPVGQALRASRAARPARYPGA